MVRFLHPLVLIALAPLPVIFFLRRGARGIVVRLLTIVLVIVALAGPQLGRREPAENVIFLIDHSPSVISTTTTQEVRDLVEAVVSANPERRFGAIAFARQAVVTDPLTADQAREHPLSLTTIAPLGAATDLAVAIDLALANLPSANRTERSADQFVLVSDGRITSGLAKALAAVQHYGIPISTLAVGEIAADDVALLSLELPHVVEVGQLFSLTITVRAEQAGEATLILYRNENLVALQEISLLPGLNPISLSDTLDDAGLHTYRALVRRPFDPIPENDALSAVVQTVERPQLLVISGGETAALEALLRASGRRFSSTTDLPTLKKLAGYREVILTGLPFADLTPQAVEALRTFVADLGGGLVVAGGEEELRGFADRGFPGDGFAGTGIEEILPISYTVPQKGREASLGLVFLLDRSSSMRGSVRGARKIDILKESVAASINLLDEEMLVGLIAFDRHYEWLVPIQPVGDGSMLYQKLRTLEAVGGTDFYYPLIDALATLEPVEARVKHILLFSDGKTVTGHRDFPGLFRRLQGQDEITLSAIAIGTAPNLPLLSTLVSAGHGELFVVSDFASLPQISVEVTQRLARNRFITGDLSVSGLLAGGKLAGLPPLSGYVLTYPKPTAEVLLWAGEDPIIARWRIGMGQVAVLNTDLAGVWSEEWLAWDRAALLLDTILAAVEPASPLSRSLRPMVEVGEGMICILVDARDEDGNFANFLDLEASLIKVGAIDTKIAHEIQMMEQIGAGLYRASFPVQRAGGYALRIVDQRRGEKITLPVHIPYPAEYRRTGVDEEALRTIARTTGGRFLYDEILPASAPGGEDLTYVNAHTHLLLAALALFLAELVVRKLPRRKEGLRIED